MKAIEENMPHEVAELICLKCHNRAIHVYPADTLLKDLECNCGVTGLLIKTGQTLSEELICSKCKLQIGDGCKLHLQSNDNYCEYFMENTDAKN